MAKNGKILDSKSRRALIFSGIPLLVGGTGLSLFYGIGNKYIASVSVFIPTTHISEYNKRTKDVIGEELISEYLLFVYVGIKENRILKRQLNNVNKNEWTSTVLFHKKNDALEFTEMMKPLLLKLKEKGIRVEGMTISRLSLYESFMLTSNRFFKKKTFHKKS